MEEKKRIRKKSAYLECGKIINTHGIAGNVKLESWCDTPYVLADLPVLYFKKEEEYIGRAVTSSAVQKRFVLLHFEGVDTPEDAEALRECIVYARREDLPLAEGDYFICDLEGLPLLDADSGEEYGSIIRVFNSGAQDILLVNTVNGERMVPMVDEFIKKIDTDDAVYVKPIEGMLD